MPNGKPLRVYAAKISTTTVVSHQLLLAVGQRFPQVKGYGVILLEKCDAG